MMNHQYERKEGFVMIQNDIFKMGLDPYAFMIYVFLASCAGVKGECWPSIPSMARVLGISPATVQSRLKILQKRRYIKKIHQGGVSDTGIPLTYNNHYIVNDFEIPWRYHYFEHKEREAEANRIEDDDIDF